MDTANTYTYPSVKHISECFIKPHTTPEESKQPLHLTPWDLLMLSAHYIQKGLLFAKPPEANQQGSAFTESLLQRLKDSLSLTLVHFYPLAGRFKTVKTVDPPSYSIHVDCNDSPGAKFIHATLDVTVSDILSPTDVPLIVHSFFDHNKAVNHDAHTLSLLSIQVTELIDGVFIGCSMSHSIGDGTSYWNFWKTWSEIFRGSKEISRPPIFERNFTEYGHGPIINLPYKHHDEFISEFEPQTLRERVFHFSAESLAKLKAKANAQSDTTKISTLQSLSAMLWRSVVKAQDFSSDTITNCRLAANNRQRLNPPISNDFFGNLVYTIGASTSVGELAEHDLGWAAWKIHVAVAENDDKRVRALLGAWLEAPKVYNLGRVFDPNSVMIGSSPRFDKYGSEFGMGRALALRSGYANKVHGKTSCYPGREGGGSIDLEVCLRPETMRRLEADTEFMEAAGLCPVDL